MIEQFNINETATADKTAEKENQMSKTQNVAPSTSVPTSTVVAAAQDTLKKAAAAKVQAEKPEVQAEKPKTVVDHGATKIAAEVKAEKAAEKAAAKAKAQEPAAPKQTPIEDRLYRFTKDESEKVTKGEPSKFRGKQRQIVYDILKDSQSPMTIAQVAKLASKAGLTAVGGVEPSVRYHLHHLTLDGFTEVVNPVVTEEATK